MISPVSRPSASIALEVLTDGAAVIEPHTGIDGQPIPDRQGIARECGRRDELAAAIRRRAGNGLKRLAVVVDESDAARNDGGWSCSPFSIYVPTFHS